MKKANKLTPAKETTLVIYYKPGRALVNSETFRNCKNPDKIISNRNAMSIKKVNYGGKPFDFSKHVALYPEVKTAE